MTPRTDGEATCRKCHAPIRRNAASRLWWTPAEMGDPPRRATCAHSPVKEATS